MRAWNLLRSGRARAFRPALAATLLVTAVIGASAFHRAIAQDVIVLPPAQASDAPAASDTSPTDGAANFVRTESTVDSTAAASSTVPTQQTSVPDPQPVAQAAAATGAADFTKFVTCATDADCVLAQDDCSDLEALNKNYVAEWLAGQPHDATCRKSFDMAKVAQTTLAVCSDKTCAMLLRKAP